MVLRSVLLVMVVYSFYIFDRHGKSVSLLFWAPLHALYISNCFDIWLFFYFTAECIYKRVWLHLPPAVSNNKTSRSTSDPSILSNGVPKPVKSSKPNSDDDAKLVFGTVFSLRNMARKLGGDDDRYEGRTHGGERSITSNWKTLQSPSAFELNEGFFMLTLNTFPSFVSYRTSQYKLHYYETPTNIKFVMLTDTKANSMRMALHQIYVNLYVEYGAFFFYLPQYRIPLLIRCFKKISCEEPSFSNRASRWSGCR